MCQVAVAVAGCAVAVLMVGVLSFPLLRYVKTIIVATNICPKKSTNPGPGQAQQFRQIPEPVPSQVTELLAMGSLHRLIEAAYQLQAGRRDPGCYRPPVLHFTSARDKPS